MTPIGQPHEKVSADQFEPSKRTVAQSIIRRIGTRRLREAEGGRYPTDLVPNSGMISRP